MTRSFRVQLAWRFSATMTLALAAVTVAGYLVLRETLDRNIDASILNVASIEAASVTDEEGGAMHFHEWDLSPDEAASLRELTRYAQVWSESGESLLRSRFLTSDLPLDSVSLRRAAAGEIVWDESPFEDDMVRSVYYPLGRLGPNHAPHILQVAASLEARNRTLRLVRVFLLALVMLVSLGSLLGSGWLAGRTIRPVHEIIDQAEGIGPRTLGARLTAHADTREYARLVQVLNTMLQRIDTVFGAQRRFTADASHELRSPLTALRGELELARRRDRSADEYRRVIDSALEETERLTQLAEGLLTLARSDVGAIEPNLVHVDVGERTRKTAERLRAKADEKRLRLDLKGLGSVTLPCDSDLIDRLVWNLVDNAIKFTTPGGRVHVSVRSKTDGVWIEVADTGPGIRDEALDRIFQRFYRDDLAHAQTDGTGLGLSIVRAIAEAHGGSVTAENRAEGGALFRVRLPNTRPAADPASH